MSTSPAHAERPKLSSYRPSLDRQLEQEADEAAREVVAGRTAPAAATAGGGGEGVQRKCGCGSAGSCECGVQRLEMGGGLLGAASELLGRARDAVFGAGLLVEDGEVAGAGQMQRSAFLGALRATVCRAADAELREVGRDTEGCPYIAHWLARLGGRSARDLERATLLYARPSVRTVDGLLAALAERTAEAVRAWKRTGSVPDLPADLPGASGEGVQRLAAPGGGGGGGDAASVRSRLGPGHPLPGSVRSRMESGFGTSFSQVRLHTDTAAASLAAEQGAIALTVGQDVVLGPQAGAPGSVPGDLVLAHELAHTIQQRGGSGAAGGSHERDADQAAAGVVLGQGGRPALSSGLALQGCRPTVKKCPPGMRWGQAANATSMGAGSFGCTCVYRCVVGRENISPYSQICPPQGCRGETVEIVGEDYVFERNGEVERAPVSERAAPGEQEIGWGGAATPLGAQAACLCPGVNIEGEDTVEAAHMEPIQLDLTDLNPGARDRTTGVPMANVDSRGRRVDPIRGPAHELVLSPQQPAGGARRPRFPANPDPYTAVDWPQGPRSVQQQGDTWCGAACGEMLTGRHGTPVPQSTLVTSPHFTGGPPPFGGFQTGALQRALTELGPVQNRQYSAYNLYDLGGNRWTVDSMRAALADQISRTDSPVIMRTDGLTHWIIVDRVLPDGRLAIRDPRSQVSQIVTAEHLYGRGSNGDIVVSEPARP
jgi:hypothetical protein